MTSTNPRIVRLREKRVQLEKELSTQRAEQKKEIERAEFKIIDPCYDLIKACRYQGLGELIRHLNYDIKKCFSRQESIETFMKIIQENKDEAKLKIQMMDEEIKLRNVEYHKILYEYKCMLGMYHRCFDLLNIPETADFEEVSNEVNRQIYFQSFEEFKKLGHLLSPPVERPGMKPKNISSGALQAFHNHQVMNSSISRPEPVYHDKEYYNSASNYPCLKPEKGFVPFDPQRIKKP